MTNADFVVIGGGIVGLATAYQLKTAFPEKSLLVLEKEDAVGTHQSGHNSGVLHSGLYYAPRSLKAKTCVTGKRALEEFCRQEDLPYRITGKIVVAVDESEVATLRSIYERGTANGVRCELIDSAEIRRREPHAAGVLGIYVPEAGVTDFPKICRRFVDKLSRQGAQVITGAKLVESHLTPSGMQLVTTKGDYFANLVINCAGLFSDRVAALLGSTPKVQIVPFRGEYYSLTEQARDLCRNLIYPTPDPQFPFLGVHFTRMIDGTVECGPNAVLAFSREGYSWSALSMRDTLSTLSYSGFIKFSLKHWQTGFMEIVRSLNKQAFTRALQRLVPDVRSEHLASAPAGVRALAMNSSGKLIDDFLIQEEERVLNVLNAPSPAATSCLSIGGYIVDRVKARFQ